MKKLKAYLLMSPMFALSISGITFLLYALYKLPCCHFYWTAQDTKTGIAVISFFIIITIIFKMFEKGHKLYRENK